MGLKIREVNIAEEHGGGGVSAKDFTMNDGLIQGNSADYGGGLNVSAVTGEGLDALRAEIAARLERLSEKAGVVEGDVSTVARKTAALVEAEAALSPFAAEDRPDLVLLGNALRRACTRLGELTGSVYSEDLLDSLFSRFCVGK